MTDHTPELLEALKALIRRTSMNNMVCCLFDNLNPCWNNRPTDKPGLHWGATDDNPIKACDLCIARAAVAKAEASR